MLYSYNGILFTDLKKKDIIPFVATWINLDYIMLSEINQSQKDKYCMVPLT